jgi:hypothetical protein
MQQLQGLAQKHHSCARCQLTHRPGSPLPLQAISTPDGYRCFLPYSQLVRWVLEAERPADVLRGLSHQERLQLMQGVPPTFVA